MKQYKGYYVDNVIFHNENEIDESIKNRLIYKFKMLTEMFAKHSSMELSIEIDKVSNILVDKYGFSWSEIEELEINTLENKKEVV